MKTNSPNPLIPQGTFPDGRGKSRFQIAALTIGAIHLVVLGPLLFQGCKRDTAPVIAEPTNASSVYTPFEPTNPPTPPANPTVTQAQVPTVVTPPAPPPEVSTPSGTEHVVVKGDSFYTLSKKYNVSMKAIADANPGVVSTRLKIGQKLQIPAATPTPTAALTAGGGAAANGGEKIHVVKSGDTLWGLHKMYGVKESAIRAANNLKTSSLKVGQKLKIPSKSSVPAPEGAPGTAPTETPAPAAPPAP